MSKTRAIAAAVVVAVAVGAFFLGGHLGTEDTAEASAVREDRAEEVISAAEEFAIAVTSYDHREFDDDVAAVLEQSTGEFHDRYAEASESLRDMVVEGKATATGTVLETAVRDVGPDRAEVMLFVDQEVTNRATRKQGPRLDRNRMIVVLERQGDRWLASDLELH